MFWVSLFGAVVGGIVGGFLALLVVVVVVGDLDEMRDLVAGRLVGRAKPVPIATSTMLSDLQAMPPLFREPPPAALLDGVSDDDPAEPDEDHKTKRRKRQHRYFGGVR